ncbi:MAG: hypothetical protein EHM24_04700 [Acidobacteria bacterium]|nr:MAG: hypothetical protein EHM24_04700 [Acidobacteriota bacterium]
MTTPHRLAWALPKAVGARSATLLAAVFLLAGAAAALAFFPPAPPVAGRSDPQAAPAVTPELRADFERWWDTQPRMTLPVSADGAKVLIVKFTDLQCPSCGLSHFAMKPKLAEYQSRYPGAVKLVTKDYPLQPECNPNVQRAVHLAACDAAAAVRMARQQGKGDALEEWFYANQSSLTPMSVRQAAATIGGVTNFNAGLATALNGIRTDVGLGKLLGVTATPTFYVNGVKCESQGQPLATPFIFVAIEYELRKAGLK